MSPAFPSWVWLTAEEHSFTFPETWQVWSNFWFPSSFRHHDVSLAPQLKANTDDYGGDPWGGKVLQGYIRNHQTGENKSYGRGLSRQWFLSYSVQCRHYKFCVTAGGDVRRVIMSPHNRLQRNMGNYYPGRALKWDQHLSHQSFLCCGVKFQKNAAFAIPAVQNISNTQKYSWYCTKVMLIISGFLYGNFVGVLLHTCTVTFTPTPCCSVRRFYDSFDKNKILHLLS